MITGNGWGKAIQVLVGKQEVPFIVHETFIGASSEFFKATLRGEWQDATQQCVKLKDVHPSLFQLYIQWLYKQDDDDVGDNQPRPPSQPVMRFAGLTPGGLARCYVLGDRLLDDRFKDHVIDILIDRFNDVQKIRDNNNKNQQPPLPKLPIPTGPDVDYIYSNTNKGSPLRLLTVRMWIRGKLSPGDLESANPPYPEAFVLQLARQLLNDSNKELKIEATFPNKGFYHYKKSNGGQKRSHDDMNATRPVVS